MPVYRTNGGATYNLNTEGSSVGTFDDSFNFAGSQQRALSDGTEPKTLYDTGDFDRNEPMELGTYNSIDGFQATTPDAGLFIGEVSISGTPLLAVYKDAPSGNPDSVTLYFSHRSFDSFFSFPSEIDFEFATGEAVPCFATGTLIDGADGEVPVESLKIGDLLRTQNGTLVPVKWVGHRRILKLFRHKMRDQIVRIEAGALGPNVPTSPLTVTADHALLLDGILCAAGALVNGETIRTVPVDALESDFTVFHVETAEHDIIRANGAPAETFVDSISRRAFSNYAEYEALYGAELETVPTLELPRAMSPRQLPGKIRARLGRTAAA
ncbi:MAG: Hint domain-containing protein [Pseudomonadota bacterium]